MGDGIDKVRVWDPLVRMFHWVLVVAFTVAYFTDDNDLLSPHVLAGYVVLGLLVFRLLWGIVGTTHARFSDFVRSPSQVVSFLRDTLQGEVKRYMGHNPAGGWMIVLLLVMLTLLSVTGLILYGADQHAGPLAGLMAGSSDSAKDWFEGLHEFCANFTLFLVIIHLAGVAMESILHRENLVWTMVTGYKRAEGGEHGRPGFRSTVKGISVLGGFLVIASAMFALGMFGDGGEVKADAPRDANLQQHVNDLIPLEKLIKRAEAEHEGRLIEAELKYVNKRNIYEIEILDDEGKVWETHYDAKTGEPIDHVEEEDK